MAIIPPRPPGAPGATPFVRSNSRDRFPPKQNNDEHRINERIRVPQVRLIDEKGEQLGILPTTEALKLARERNLDLMEVAPNATPPVCKITDYGKFKYEEKKKEQQAKKKQVVIKVKEVQLRPQIEVHDLDYKLKNIRSFLEEGDKAKISMLFRGREVTHTELGYDIMRQIVETLKDISVVEAPAKLEGKRMIMVLGPSGKK